MANKKDFRNYNLGRVVDERTEEFENKLEELLKEYDVYRETETFEEFV